MNSFYIQKMGEWIAFTTIDGVDLYAFADTEIKARANLAKRILSSGLLDKYMANVKYVR